MNGARDASRSATNTSTPLSSGIPLCGEALKREEQGKKGFVIESSYKNL